MRELTCSHLLAAADAPVTHRQTIRIDGERIAAVASAAPGAAVEPVLALPVLCNAHDHARTVRHRGRQIGVDRRHERSQGIVRHLDDIGLLSPRLTLAHCTWARPDELELLAERGAIISGNASSNLSLRSGIAPVGEMVRRGCRVALGLDGATLDEDDDALRELRLSYLLHGGTGFRIDVSRSAMLTSVLRTGRASVLNRDDGGRLAAGEPADLLLLDWDAIDDDRLRPDVDPLDLIFARATARHIREMIVGGRTVVRQGKVLGIDFPAMREELDARLRAGMAGNAAFAAALAALERVVHPHFETEAPCC